MSFVHLCADITDTLATWEQETGDVSSCPLKQASVGILAVSCQFSLVGVESLAEPLIWGSLAHTRPQRWCVCVKDPAGLPVRVLEALYLLYPLLEHMNVLCVMFHNSWLSLSFSLDLPLWQTAVFCLNEWHNDRYELETCHRTSSMVHSSLNTELSMKPVCNHSLFWFFVHFSTAFWLYLIPDEARNPTDLHWRIWATSSNSATQSWQASKSENDINMLDFSMQSSDSV